MVKYSLFLAVTFLSFSASANISFSFKNETDKDISVGIEGALPCYKSSGYVSLKKGIEQKDAYTTNGKLCEADNWNVYVYNYVNHSLYFLKKGNFFPLSKSCKAATITIKGTAPDNLTFDVQKNCG